jgi:hypothetical protein
VQRLAEDFARRVQREAGNEPLRQVDWIYLTALSRPPNEEEKQLGLLSLTQLTESWSKRLTEKDAASLKALTTYCHTILNSAAFLYVD